MSLGKKGLSSLGNISNSNAMTSQNHYGQSAGFLTDMLATSFATYLDSRYKFSKTPHPLTFVDSPFYPGLKLIQKGEGPKPKSSAIMGTVRMGYGHHRMAMAGYSHILDSEKIAYLHDLLAIESPEAEAIHSIDGFYSYWSRLSAEVGGVVEWAWGQFTSNGTYGSLHLSLKLAESYRALLSDVDTSLPYISTYPLNGQIAKACGMENVVHMICDNFPQYFLLVPGALNLVQTQSAYTKFLGMGVPKSELAYAGHWVSSDIRKNILKDTSDRIKRCDDDKPRRLLIPVGGAGAQKSYLIEFFALLEKEIQDHSVTVFLNVGDHKSVYQLFQEFFQKKQWSFKTVTSQAELDELIATANSSKELGFPIYLCHFSTHTEAFSATEYLIRISDVLLTKPSELAFYPIPKLFLRRVGDHEAYSAVYSNEIGEGTVECRESANAYSILKLFLGRNSDLFKRMNECVLKNHDKKIYDGAKNAIEIALSKRKGN